MRIIGADVSLAFSICWEASEGKEFGAAHKRCVDMLNTARQGFDRYFLAVDSGPSFRKVCSEYKANRTDRGEGYRDQLKRTIDRLAADGWAVIVAPEVGTFPANGAKSYAEADDVMGWAVEQYSKIVGPLSEEATAAYEFVIYSDDSDLEQLIDDAANVRVVKSQLRGGEKWNEARVVEKRGVPPTKIPDLKALAGDDSDDYDGFCGETPAPTSDVPFPKRKPGIGDVTAAKLIRKYGGALEIFDNGNPEKWESDGQPPGLRATLARHGRAVAEKGIFLATIRRDLPGLDFAAVLAPPVMKKIETRAPYFAPDPSVPPAYVTDEQAAHSENERIRLAAPEVIGEPVDRSRIVTPQQSTALATRIVGTPMDIYGLQPRNIPELEMYAEIVINSRSYSFSNKEQVMMCIIEARERGVPIGAALRAAYNVRGKLAWSASYLAALVLSSGKSDYFEITSTTSKRAELAYKRIGRPGGTFDFTIDEAQDAGWMRSGDRGDNKWITNPRTMLRWAAMREAARAFFQDVVNNMYTPDELGGTIRPAEFEAEIE